MKKIIRLLTLALLTVPVTTFAQSEGNQNTSEPAGKVVASKPDSLLDWDTARSYLPSGVAGNYDGQHSRGSLQRYSQTSG